jgi:hypothetical protein
MAKTEWAMWANEQAVASSIGNTLNWLYNSDGWFIGAVNVQRFSKVDSFCAYIVFCIFCSCVYWRSSELDWQV